MADKKNNDMDVSSVNGDPNQQLKNQNEQINNLMAEWFVIRIEIVKMRDLVVRKEQIEQALIIAKEEEAAAKLSELNGQMSIIADAELRKELQQKLDRLREQIQELEAKLNQINSEISRLEIELNNLKRQSHEANQGMLLAFKEMILAGDQNKEAAGFKLELDVDQNDLTDKAKSNPDLEISKEDIAEAVDAVLEEMKEVGEEAINALEKVGDDLEELMEKVADKLGITKIAKFLDEAFKPDIANRDEKIKEAKDKMVGECKGALCERVNKLKHEGPLKEAIAKKAEVDGKIKVTKEDLLDKNKSKDQLEVKVDSFRENFNNNRNDLDDLFSILSGAVSPREAAKEKNEKFKVTANEGSKASRSDNLAQKLFDKRRISDNTAQDQSVTSKPPRGPR